MASVNDDDVDYENEDDDDDDVDYENDSDYENDDYGVRCIYCHTSQNSRSLFCEASPNNQHATYREGCIWVETSRGLKSSEIYNGVHNLHDQKDTVDIRDFFSRSMASKASNGNDVNCENDDDVDYENDDDVDYENEDDFDCENDDDVEYDIRCIYCQTSYCSCSIFCKKSPNNQHTWPEGWFMTSRELKSSEAANVVHNLHDQEVSLDSRDLFSIHVRSKDSIENGDDVDYESDDDVSYENDDDVDRENYIDVDYENYDVGEYGIRCIYCQISHCSWSLFCEDSPNSRHTYQEGWLKTSRGLKSSESVNVVHNSHKQEVTVDYRDFFKMRTTSKASEKHSYSRSENKRSQSDLITTQNNITNQKILLAKNEIEIASRSKVKLPTFDKKVKKCKLSSDMETGNTNKRRRIDNVWLEEDSHTVENTTQECTKYNRGEAKLSEFIVDNNEEILPTVTPVTTHIQCHDFKRVYFDLETASLATGTDILQISAICGTRIFDQYITPVGYIDPIASEVTGLTFHEGMLMLHGNPVASVYVKEALNLFIKWLRELGTCLLIAHNAHFDARHICYHVKACKIIEPFTKVVCGFSDTLTILKNAYPGRKTYTQISLVSDILKESYDAHNALADVKSLRKLINTCGTTDKEMKSKAFSSSSVFEKQKNIASLQVLINENVLSKPMAMKTAMSGIQLHHLNLSIKQGGFEALRSLLTDIIDEKPRVTKDKKIITRLFEFLSEI